MMTMVSGWLLKKERQNSLTIRRRSSDFSIVTPNSRTFFFSYNSRYKLTIDSGKGCFLKTTDGKNYLDCVSGIATCALGHNNEYLTSAIENQMKKVHHVSNLYYIPEQAALANWLCTNSGADKAFFCNSGAEANEAAIKCARRYASNRGIDVSGKMGIRMQICGDIRLNFLSLQPRRNL